MLFLDRIFPLCLLQDQSHERLRHWGGSFKGLFTSYSGGRHKVYRVVTAKSGRLMGPQMDFVTILEQPVILGVPLKGTLEFSRASLCVAKTEGVSNHGGMLDDFNLPPVRTEVYTRQQ